MDCNRLVRFAASDWHDADNGLEIMYNIKGEIDTERFITHFKTIFLLNISLFPSIVFGMFTLAMLFFYPLSSLADPQIIEIASDEEEDGDEDEDEDFEEGNIIQICCAWNDALSDGILTYFIDSEHSSNEQAEAVRNGIEKWDTEINGLELEESTENNYDIKVGFEDSNDQDIAGQTLNTFDGYGLINDIEITIFKETKDFQFNDEIIEQITEHEMGHALGLGHANFAGNLMAAEINYGTETISDCEIEGVYMANSWYLEKDVGPNTGPIYPEKDSIRCDI